MLLVAAPRPGASQTRTAQPHAPTATSQNVIVNEDGRALIALSGSDSSRHRLTFAVVSPPAHGTLSGRPPRLTYAPDANYNGPDSFTFTATDGRADSEPATVSIAVTPVNDPPTAVDDGVIIGTNVKGFVGPGAVDVLVNDLVAPDADETLTVVNTQQGTNGGTGFSPTTVYYLPNGAYVGKDRFTYTVCDDGITNGVPDRKCTLAIVSVTVKEAIAADLSVSVAPSAPSATVASDVPVVVTVRNDGPDDANLVTYGLQAADIGMSLVSMTAAQGQCESGARGFECVLGTLVPGASITATAVMKMAMPGQRQINGYVSSSTDSTPDNNVAAVTIDVR